MKYSLLTACLCVLSLFSYAQNEIDSTRKAMNARYTFQEGTVTLEGKKAKIVVPKGYKFLDKKQSEEVLTKVWGNPSHENMTLGMLFPKDATPADGVIVFNLSFEEMGYVKDEDANSVDYDAVLKEVNENLPEANKARKAQGAATVSHIKWAEKPFYDKEKHAMHWAKAFLFEGDDEETLNYDIRFLGRKGVLEVSAIGKKSQLAEAKAAIPTILAAVKFTEGERYSDFNPSVDKVAAYTVGGLVAGKILAKVGFFALLFKFWKVIAIAFVAVGSFVWRMFSGKKNENDEPVVRTAPTTDTPQENQ